MKGRKKIVVLDYDPEWAKQFELLRQTLDKYIGKDVIGIEHVGSTSVVGLKAKPIIDLDIIIEDTALVLEKIIDKLDKLGYNHVGDLGITGREAFKSINPTTPNDGSNRTWFKHNLYVCEKGSIGLQNHLSFRDYLRANSEKIIEYGQLKSMLSQQYPYDIDAYIDGKTNFIINILNKVGMKESDTSLIDKENKKP